MKIGSIWQVFKSSWYLLCVFSIDPISAKYDENVALEWIKNCAKKSLKWHGLTVCYYHLKYAFQNESTLCSFLNVKELLARIRQDVWNLSDDKGTRTHNHFVYKWPLNHLA